MCYILQTLKYILEIALKNTSYQLEQPPINLSLMQFPWVAIVKYLVQSFLEPLVQYIIYHVSSSLNDSIRI